MFTKNYDISLAISALEGKKVKTAMDV